MIFPSDDDDDLDADVRKDPLASCPDRAAARELRAMMGEISEDHYAAGWLSGLEFTLWRIIFEQPEERFSFASLTFEERGKLIELTHRCQGWWIWSSKRGGREFLTYDEWLPMYQRGPKG